MRAFSYIADVIPPLASTAFREKTNREIINLGSDEVVTINEACKTVIEVMGSKLEPVHVEERPGEVKFAYCTTEKSQRLLGFKTKHTLRAGIRKMVDWAAWIGPHEPSYTVPLEIKKRVPKVWKEKLV